MRLNLVKGGSAVRLAELVGRGGEGAVYALVGNASAVAKIYEAPPKPQKVQKLIRMCELLVPSLSRVAAWPTDLLQDEERKVRGFIMPRIASRRGIHELYSPKSRLTCFPEADFRFVLQAAANIARAFATVHEQGHVVGDINYRNLLVGPDAKVVFIDCDSFQISAGTSPFYCSVGSSLFTAPELQGRPFKSLFRTPSHDLFGLAVLLFYLLYMGRHPFAGRFLDAGDMPIETAITQHRFAYAPDRHVHRMERPPGTIPLEAMGPKVAELFCQAFGRETQDKRPSARQWLEALTGLQSDLKSCDVASWHFYRRHAESCPWCVLESQTGVNLFGQQIQRASPGETVNVEALWQAIVRVAGPGDDPPLPSATTWLPPKGQSSSSFSGRTFQRILAVGILCGGLAACSAYAKQGGFFMFLGAVGLAFAIWPRISAEERKKALSAYTDAQREWEEVLAEWKREALRETFDSKLTVLKQKRGELEGLAAERSKGIAKLNSEKESRQRERYLDRFRIENGKIKGIGSSRIAKLASYGIETAADIERTRIASIQGFGASLIGELLSWRNSHLRNFRPNPSEPIDAAEIAKLDLALSVKREAIIRDLRGGPSSLVQVRERILAARSRLAPLVEDGWNKLKLAELRRASVI